MPALPDPHKFVAHPSEWRPYSDIRMEAKRQALDALSGPGEFAGASLPGQTQPANLPTKAP
jgi:hypothetical protein